MKQVAFSTVLLLLLLSSYTTLFSQTTSRINPEDIQIARDKWGVPHIFAPTDPATSYGLAWAYCEDNFKDMQYAILSSKGMFGRVKGTKGVLFDYALKLLQVDTLVAARYESDLSPEFRQVMAGYVQGINDYAASHPKEVIYAKAFPVTPQEIIQGYVLKTSLMAGLGLSLKSIKEDRIEEILRINAQGIGSNALAIGAEAMEDDLGTYLLVNSHQPLEGQSAWYEAHVCSESGWEMIGGTFAGGATIFVGSNRHLGWAHTNNYHNFGDVYQLEINPKNKNQYRYDGEWKDMSIRKIKLTVKIAGIPIKIGRKVYDTAYGPVFKTKKGSFAFRFGGYTDIRCAEQWYRMNKASNLQEFEAALQMQSLALFNVVYADDGGNIMLHSGGRVPLRDPALDWSAPITANTSAYRWTEIVPYPQMPTLRNPKAGYIYNANNTPLHATAMGQNWEGDFVGLQRFEYNRGQQFGQFLAAWQAEHGKFTEQGLHVIKYNTGYNKEEGSIYLRQFRQLFELDPEKYPQLAAAIAHLKAWNLESAIDNRQAALAMVTHYFLAKKLKSGMGLLLLRPKTVTEEEAAWALQKAQRFLKRTHGSIDIPLGEVQRLIRGEVSLPADGASEVLRATEVKLHNKKKGIFRKKGGDCYIQVTRFSEKGAYVRSANAYGASSRPESPHYTDQMELFTKKQYKEMTFDKEKILAEAKRVYHPEVKRP